MKTNYNIYEFALLLKLLTDKTNNHDAITVISGARGMGKSVLGMDFMKVLLGDGYCTEKSMEYHNIYQPGDLIKKLDKCPDNTPLLVDEAINVLFKRDFAKKEQKVNIKIFNTHRDKRLIAFLLVPNFFDIDSSIRNSLIIKFWIHVFNRGKAWIFGHENNPATDDPFCRANIFYWHMKKRIYRAQNYIGNLQFPNIKPETYAIYQEIKRKKRLLEEVDIPKFSNKDLVMAIHRKNPEARNIEIAKVTGIAPSHISKFVRGLDY